MIFKQLPTMVGDLNKLGIALKSLDAMKLGTVGVNLGNVEAYRAALKGLSVEQSVFALASKGATEEQIRQILVTNQATAEDVEAAMAKAGLTTATQALTQAEMVEMATKTGVAKATAEELLSKIGITATETGQIPVKKQVTRAMLEQAVASGTLTKAEASQIATMLGLNAVETTNIGITNVLTASFTKLWAVITAHPIGAILTAIGAVAVGAIAYINKTNKEAEEALVEAHENAKQALDDTKNSLSEDKSELQSVNSELETTKERLKEISSIGAPTLTEQNELTKLSTTNAQLEAQQALLENNIKLKQKSAALDAKELLGTQVEMEYSRISDDGSIVSNSESYDYKDHAKHQTSQLKMAYNKYMKALREGNVKGQISAKELIDASAGNAASLTSELLKIVESFKYDDGTIIEGYEDLYNEYMGMIYNLQSLTNPDTFLEVAKFVTTGTGIDYEKAISEAYKLAYEGNFDISNLNQDFVKALVDAGIDESTIEYIFKLKQQEYQSIVDKINSKYDSSKFYALGGSSEDTDRLRAEVDKINQELNKYAKEKPIEFQLISSYDENFTLLDKYIEEEKVKATNNADYVGDYIQNAIQHVYDEAKLKNEKHYSEFNILDTISETVEHLDKKVKPVMDSLKSAYQDIFTEDGFTLDNVGVDMLNSVKEAIAEINELDGVDVSTTAFEDFAKVLSTTEITMDGVKNKEEEVHKAFNNLVGDIVNGTDSTFVSSEAFNTLVQSLEEMGVTNANEALTEVKKTQDHLIKQGIDIDNITADEADAFLKEAEALGISTQWFKTYTLQKAIAENPLDTTEDIKALEDLCNVLGVTGEMLEYVNSIKYANQMIDFRNQTGMGAPVEAYEATIENAKKNIQRLLDEGSIFEFDFKFDGSKDDSNTSSSKDSTSDIDWIETKLANVDKDLNNLNDTIDNTYSNWTDRSKALKDAITDTEKAIGLQGQAYTKYMQKAESIKLPEYLKERVRLGDMSIQNDVNSETKELIDEYSEWYEKAQEAKEAQDELNKSLLELKASDTVDMIEEYYDAIDEAHSNSIESTQNKIDKAETMGFFANGSYYDNIGEELAKQKSNLEKKKADLDKVLANSGLDKNSSSYTELQNLIGSISNEIQQLTIDIEDNKNAAQENEWNYFDYLRESVTRLIEEADFFIELMSNEDLFDDKGNFTKYADATLALHNSNYEVYMANAREYAEEMKALEDDLADGKDVVDRYRELEDAQRDAIQSAQDERKAILDLIEEGYQKQLDYLNEIIDKKKESLNAEKSLYDYQKSIEEKTKTRDSLRRQLDVYKNDNSEEGLAQAQKLSVELQKAEDDLAETEYEKMINDTEQMLDALSSEYEEWMNARLDNEDELLRQIQDKLGENGDINSTLKEISDKYGVSMSDSLKTAIVDGKPFDNVVTAINNLIDKITGLVGVDSNSDGSSNTSTDNTKPTTNTDVKQPTANNTNQPSQPIDTQSKSEADNIFIPQKSVYPKGKLDKDGSVVDRLKYFDFASDFSSRAIYYKKLGGSGAFTGSGTQNKWLLSKMKEMGYVSGTNYAKKGLHWTQENGDELIIRKSDGALLTPLGMGDKVVNAEGTNNLFTFANDPQGFLEKFGVLNYTPNLALPKMPNIQPRNISNEVNLGGVHIAQVVTSDAQDFMRQLPSVIANDTKTQKVISEVVLGGALGRNSMSAKRFL